MTHTYTEEINIKKIKSSEPSKGIKFLDKMGELGYLIALQMKLIWRNKRSKPIIFISLIFVLYGLFFYPQKIYLEGFGFLIFVGVFITGLFILSFGRIMNVGFEKVFLMQNPQNIMTSEVIATYIYKVGLVNNDYSFSTAVGFFNAVINLGLLAGVNAVAKRVSGSGLW